MFDFFISFYYTILYQPLFNGLVLLYQYLPGHDFGIAVITLTLIIRLILYPSTVKSIRSQKALSELQPKIKEIQKKHKDDREAQSRAMIELYKKEKINPISGCLPLLFQLPILIALYQVFWKGLLPEQMYHLYSFVANPGIIDSTFLGMVDLVQPSIILALLAGVFQFFQSKMLVPKTTKGQGKDFSQMMQKQMVYFFPIFTVFILWHLPSAVGLYWIVISIFSIAQQHFVLNPLRGDKDEAAKSAAVIRAKKK